LSVCKSNKINFGKDNWVEKIWLTNNYQRLYIQTQFQRKIYEVILVLDLWQVVMVYTLEN